eukprot:TRINITY_DN29568_c0_g1_i1.p1 TRINITY_DN29568_c0_g1~~TRINITY_DN29568_c0_g1_i1.p1  ORF type:complete len:357 (+),score=88.15 TRINITY_DN29568_c0_g1_i1:43-1113(+)
MCSSDMAVGASDGKKKEGSFDREQSLSSRSTASSFDESEDPGLAFSEDWEEGWFRLGAPTCFLQQIKEEDVASKPTSSPLPVLHRSAALRSLAQLLNFVTRSQSGWFKGAAMLDSYCSEASPRVELLPAICASLVRILHKSENRASQSFGMDALSLQHGTSELSSWLSAAGHEVPEMTEELLLKQEMSIVNALGWKVKRACVEQCSMLFGVRFEFLAGSAWQRCLREMGMKILVLGRAVVMCQAAVATVTQRSLSLGLHGLCMIEAGILPLDFLRPEDMDSEEWTAAFIRSQPDGVAPMCRLQPEQCEEAWKNLQASTGTTIYELQEAAGLAAAALGTALEGIRDMQQGGRAEAAV